MATTQKRKAPGSPSIPHKRNMLETSANASISVHLAETSDLDPNLIQANRSISASPTLISIASTPVSAKMNTEYSASVSTRNLIKSMERPASNITETETNNGTASGESDNTIDAQRAHTVAASFANTTTEVATSYIQVVRNSMMSIPISSGNGFPIFHSGNVTINTGVDFLQPFQLHSTVLARHSSWFRSQFSTEVDHGQHFFSLEEVNGLIQLVHHQPHPDDSVRRFEQDEASNMATNINTMDACVPLTIPNSTLSPLRGINDNQVSTAVNRSTNEAKALSYYQIFGVFYSIRPNLSTTDLGSALIQAEELVNVAITLDCLNLVRPYIGNTLAQYRQKLFLAVKSDPARWIKLAISIEDTSIYTECLIHLVGAHPNWIWPTSKTSLSTELCQLISKKSKELDLLCVEIDRDLLMITINVGQGRNQEPVPCHRSQIETWMIVQLFRDTVARCLHNIDKPKQRSINRGSIYRKIHKGGSAYLGFEEVQIICHGTMQTSWRDLGGELNILKEYASEIVRDLARNELMIDPEEHKIGYLTCTKIKPEDIPWQ